MDATLSDELERQLPILRAFAFAATQDLEQADLHVEEALRLIASELDSRSINSAGVLKFRAYQLVEIVMVSHVKIPPSTTCNRIMILLHLGEFTKQDCQKILDVSETCLNECIAEYSERIEKKPLDPRVDPDF